MKVRIELTASISAEIEADSIEHAEAIIDKAAMLAADDKDSLFDNLEWEIEGFDPTTAVIVDDEDEENDDESE